MNVRTPLILAAVATAALAGCSSTTTTGTATPTSTVPSAGATTTAPGPTAGSTTAGVTTARSSAPAPSTSPSTTKPATGTCPPSEATLLRALRSSKVSDALAPTDTLTGITCYRGYALGLTHPKQADNAEVVFHYTAGAWHAVNGGTSGYCDGVVPAAVRPHLKHC